MLHEALCNSYATHKLISQVSSFKLRREYKNKYSECMPNLLVIQAFQQLICKAKLRIPHYLGAVGYH